METSLRSALGAWLGSDPELSLALNAITQEAPTRTSPPSLAIVASASTDWSTKGRRGREVRVALELCLRGEHPDESGAITRLLEDRIAAVPSQQDGYRIVTATFLRARTEQRPNLTRAVLLEYRFRLLED